MSADAKIWFDDETRSWRGVHDLACEYPNDHYMHEFGLRELIINIEEHENNGHPMRWELRVYPDGKAGLSGYSA